MSEGRDQLQKAIEGWESRCAVALAAKHEADIVLPFLRAAVEELDAFRKNGQRVEAVAPVAETPRARRPEFVAVVPDPVPSTPEPVAVEPEPVAVEPEPVAVEPEPANIIETNPTPFSGDNDNEAVNGPAAAIGSDEGAEQSDDSISSAFGRKSIASLIEEAEKEGAAS